MKPRWRRVVQFPIVILAAVLAVVTTPNAAGAAGAGLWRCAPFTDPYYYACTRITSAPADGVRVLDRYAGGIRILHNGDSVALKWWYKDTSGKCGVGGDPYVWEIAWQSSGYHLAIIGDYYLNTGSVSNWNNYPDYWGTLGDDFHDFGTGSGTCDVFPSD